MEVLSPSIATLPERECQGSETTCTPCRSCELSMWMASSLAFLPGSSPPPSSLFYSLFACDFFPKTWTFKRRILAHIE